jgi:hypothetical protein
MQANPDKFQAISIGRKTHEKNFSFMLQGNKIDCEVSVNHLISIAICSSRVSITSSTLLLP